MIKEFATDFEFKGDRQYVHSSTLIEAVSRIVDTHFLPQEEWFLPRVDGRFHQEIKTNGTLRVTREGEPLPEQGQAPARLRFHDKAESFNVIFLENRARKVRRRISPVYAVHEMTLEGQFAGTCTIDGSNRIAFVENIIEANKRLHVMTLQEESGDFRIVNLYVKGFPVSFSPVKGQDACRLKLHIRNTAIRSRADSVVTLNSLHFPQKEMDPFEVCFAVYRIQHRK